MPALLTARRAALAAPMTAAAAALIVATAPTASATDGSVFSFPRLGTVVVDGVVDDDVNFTVYQILDPNCTGTAFPGPSDSCVPQKATDTLVIAAGTYHDKKFHLADIPTCGPTQQDVYDGPYQSTVTASGTHNYLAGGILQLGTCASPSPSPSSSSPTTSPSGSPSNSPSSSPSPSTSSATKPRSSTSAPSTTPAVSTTTPSTSVSSVSVTGDFDAADASTTFAAQAGPTQLASTGPDHTAATLGLGLGAVLLGGATLAIARRRPNRLH